MVQINNDLGTLVDLSFDLLPRCLKDYINCLKRCCKRKPGCSEEKPKTPTETPKDEALLVMDERSTPAVPGEGEDCAALRRNWNYYKEAAAKSPLSGPESRKAFEKEAEINRRAYCQCLIDKHVSPLPEACKDVATAYPPKPAPNQTPGSTTPKKPNKTLGYLGETKPADGLYVSTFNTPYGQIITHFTDDLGAHDTIFGTVETVPAGKDDAERAKNDAELKGCVIEMEGQKTPVGDKKITCSIPATLTDEAKAIVLVYRGQTVCTADLPISATPQPTPTEFTIPTGGQMGRPIPITGPCNPAPSTTDVVDINGKILPDLAKSPRKRVVLNTCEVEGRTTIRCRENGATMECPFQNISVKLSVSKYNLLRGETATLYVMFGLAGIQEDVPYDLVVTTPNVIKMSGGEVQHRNIRREEVQPDGKYQTTRTLTGIMAGGYGITVTARWTKVCKHPAVPKKP